MKEEPEYKVDIPRGYRFVARNLNTNTIIIAELEEELE